MKDPLVQAPKGFTVDVQIVPQSIKRLWITPNAAKIIELAGRTCYKSEAKITKDSAAAFIARIIASGHESVLEHASASYRLITDRGITHELVRHRLASYSQESTRYVNYGKVGTITVVEPLWSSIMTVRWEDKHTAWVKSVKLAAKAYHDLLALGCSPQEARDVLPTCTKAEIVVTANFREWRHIIKLRTDKAAHPKIRQLIGMVRNDLAKLCPPVFGKV